MKEHPILFSDEMVRAILDGRKTQTRRPCKPQPPPGTQELGMSDCREYFRDFPGETRDWKCPFGGPGDTLWVRECWGSTNDYDGDVLMDGITALYRADQHPCVFPNRWRPSIHMPRWASRITLTVTDVRVERVWEINEEDARDEGVDTHAYSWPEGTTPNHARDCGGLYRNGFRNLWDSIYADKGFGWDENPWVWVGEFEKVNK